jgi:hypothetical protein
VPHHCHCRNAAECAIRTIKEYFVAGLSSVYPTFPLQLWYRLLLQAEITLNLLQTSRLHPQLSSAAHFHGLVDYNKAAFAPPVCKIIAHAKPGKRRTWAPHGPHVYSLGPAMHHYLCQNVYISATASERIVDTLEFFPHNHPMSQLSSTNRFIMAAKDMTDALQNPHPEVPFAHMGGDTIKALADLASTFKLKLRQTSPPTRPAAPSTVNKRTCLAKSSDPILASPMPPPQTRPQTTIHTHDVTNAPTPSEGGHAGDAQPVTSEGAHSLAASRSPQPFTKRFLRHGHFSHGHRPRKHPLVSAASRKRLHPPRHRKRNGIHGAYEGPRLQPLWKRGFGNECGRLFQGTRDIPGTDTCFFIKLTNIPKVRKITYGKIV